MTTPHDPHKIDTLVKLESLFGDVSEASIKKEIPFIHPLYRAWIEASPFAVLATVGSGGLDTSPRGDPTGFVVVQDDKTLLLPERPGNNRVDSLRNILADPRVALLFLIPGVGETLRVNGQASITTAPELLERCQMRGKSPKCILVIKVDTVFFQCARAIHRSNLWQSPSKDLLARVPTAGTLLAALTDAVDQAQYDQELPARQRSTLY